MTPVALKVLLAPGFVVLISLVARRFGSRVGGVVSGLPVIAAPILLVLALDHGRDFARSAAVGTLLGVVAVMAFVVAYAFVCRRLAWQWAVLAGWSCFAVAVLALRSVHVGALAALALAVFANLATLVVLPRPSAAHPGQVVHPPGDLAIRAACAAIPVLVVTSAAGTLGSHLSGLLASFPVITPVVAAFTQVQRGAAESLRLLHGLAVGFFAYTMFCFVVSVTVRPLGIAASFSLALLVALAVQSAALLRVGRDEVPLVEAAA